MMTSIGEITVGTLLKRVRNTFSPYMTREGIYEVVEIDNCGPLIYNDRGQKLYVIFPPFYKIVGHVDSDIIQELDQMLNYFLNLREI